MSHFNNCFKKIKNLIAEHYEVFFISNQLNQP